MAAHSVVMVTCPRPLVLVTLRVKGDVLARQGPSSWEGDAGAGSVVQTGAVSTAEEIFQLLYGA